MLAIPDLLNTLVLGLAVLGAVAALSAGTPPRREVRLVAITLLAFAALGLLASLSVAAWLPDRALVAHADGSTDDPRVMSAMVLGIAGLALLAPALRALRLPGLRLLALSLPGLGLAGVVAAVLSFAGLRSPVGLATLALGGGIVGAGITVFLRQRRGALGALALQVGATGLLVATAALSLHGARATGLELREGAAVDTLGLRLSLAGVEAPGDSLRLIRFQLAGGRAPVDIRTALVGREGEPNRQVAGGGLFDGPVIVPLALRETRPQPHDLVWLTKGDTVTVESSTLRFVGFRILPGDTIRMLADLDVTIAGHTQRVSPGMYARSEGTTPFAAVAEGLGPISLARMDADNHRVALMLPMPSTTAVNRVVSASLHLRPALPVAWLAGALVVAAWLLGLVARTEERTARR